MAGPGLLSRQARLHGARLHGARLHGGRPGGTGLRRLGSRAARARIARQPVPGRAAIRLRLARRVAIRPGIGGRLYRPEERLRLGPGPAGVASRSPGGGRSWRRCGHPPPANGARPADGLRRALPGRRISGSRVSPWPQAPCVAARIGCRVTRWVCGQIAIFAAGWRRFLRLLGWPGLAEVANPVVIGIRLGGESGFPASVPRLTAA